MIDIKTDAADVAAVIQAAAIKQLPYTLVRTVNDLVFLARDDVYAQMEREFDRPTPRFTLNSLEVMKAKPKGVPSARLHLRYDREFQRALAPQFVGGDRVLKRMENSFQKIGLLPKGRYMVPAEGCPLDAYGNPQRSVIVQIMAYLQAFGEQGYRANIKNVPAWEKRMAKKTFGMRVSYFVSQGKGRPNSSMIKNPRNLDKLPAGIWQRFEESNTWGGSVVRPIFLFVRRPHYRRLITLPEIAEAVVRKDAGVIFAKHFKNNIMSDRRVVSALKNAGQS